MPDERSRGQNPDEIFDIVDASDTPVSRGRRSFIHANGLMHRAVHAIFFDSCGRILLQKRALTKDSYPGAYTTSCSGHVDAGEGYDEALLREAREELGVSLPLSAYKKIGKIEACPESENEFTWVYAAYFDGPFECPPDEVDSVEWAEREDFERAAAERPELFTPSFLKAYSFYKERAKAQRNP